MKIFNQFGHRYPLHVEATTDVFIAAATPVLIAALEKAKVKNYQEM